MNKWISTEDRKPETIIKDGCCDAVLVWWTKERENGYQYGISNTIFARNTQAITHWMPLPPPPEKA